MNNSVEHGKHIIHSLNGSSPDEIIPLLRRVIQRLRESPGFSDYARDVKRLAEINAQATSISKKIKDSESQLSAQEEAENKQIAADLKSLAKTLAQLRNGSYRLFSSAIESVPLINARGKTDLKEQMREAYVLLNKLDRTLSTLEWFASKPNGPEDGQRRAVGPALKTYKLPATLRFEVFTCGGTLGRSGHHLVLHISKNWGGCSSRKSLFNYLLHWPPATSPKFDPPIKNAA